MPWQLTIIHEQPGDDRERVCVLRLAGPGPDVVLSHAARHLTITGRRVPRGGLVGPYGFDLVSLATRGPQAACNELLGRTSTAAERGWLMDLVVRFSRAWLDLDERRGAA